MTTAPRNYASKQADAPQLMREAAEKSTAQAKENFEKFSTASGEATEAVKDAYLTAIDGAQNYSAKVMEFAQANTNAAFAAAKELARVKSPTEFIERSAEHSRRSLKFCRGRPRN